MHHCAILCFLRLRRVFHLFFFFSQGKPVGTPDAGAFFRVMSEHGAASMFTAPTAIRAIRQQDPDAAIGRKFALSR